MMGDVLETNDAVMAYRMELLETSLRELRGEFKESIGVLGGGLTALQTQLSSYQTTQMDRFVPRREWEAKHREHQDRLDQLADQAGSRGWQVAAALIMALVSAIFTAIGWVAHLPHP